MTQNRYYKATKTQELVMKSRWQRENRLQPAIYEWMENRNYSTRTKEI